MSLAGKTAIVVGGTSGIGHGIALRLAQAGCSVTLVGRSEARGQKIVAELSAAGGGQHSMTPVNCFSLKAVSEFANGYVASAKPLDFLVMTQGMATLQGFSPTPAEHGGGLDEKLTLHYYSRVALAKTLAPALARAEGARVLSVLSAGVHSPYQRYAQDPELSRGNYSLGNAANAAGFYNDIAAEMLSKEQPGVSFSHAAPGFVKTRWGTEMPWAVRMLVRLLQHLGRDQAACGEFMFTPLHADAQKSGGFHLVDQYGQPGPKVTSLHDAAKADVWAHTLKVVERLGSAAVADKK